MNNPRRKRSCALAVAVGLTSIGSLIPATPSLAAADPLPRRSYVTNGPVQAVIRSGDTVYLAGRFNRFGPRTGPGVEFGLDGSQTAGMPEVTGAGGMVNAVASDGAGGWYIGGDFTHVGGIPRSNIAHILSSHAVDPAFDPNANGNIHALEVSGSTIYVAGLFTTISGQTRNRIAGLDTATGAATAFNPNADAAVESLAIAGPIIYAGGRFTTIGGQPRANLAALNAADGSIVATFSPAPDGIVVALEVSGTKLYVGGWFKAIGGQPRSNIAALNLGGPLDGTAVATFNPNANAGGSIPSGAGGVETLTVSHDGATVYAGGLFTNIGGQPRRYFAALSAADGTATSWNPNSNGNPIDITVSADDSTVYVVGGFNAYDGLPSIGGAVRNYIAAIDAATGLATAFDPPQLNSAAMAIAITDTAAYVGGSFSSVGGLTRRGIAAIDATTGEATSFNPEVRYGAFGNATVYSLAVSGSTLYAGGFFTHVGGQPRSNIAAIDLADGTPTAWNPGANSTVEALTMVDSLLYAGGTFTTIGGTSRQFLAALSLETGTPTAFNPGPNGAVQAIVRSGPLLYVGGFFTTIAGQPRNKVAALQLSDGTPTSWDPDATTQANVLAIAVSDDTVYLGGNFSSIGGVARSNLAAVNVDDGEPTSFDPQTNEGVYALALSGASVYVGGFFSSIAGQTRHLIAELDPVTGDPTSFDPGADPGFGVFDLTVVPDGTLYVGGSFRTFDLAFQQGIATFSGPPLNVAPIAALAAGLTTGAAPLQTILDASGSSDPDGDALSYTFDPGDGSPPVTQAAATLSHRYATTGSYTATLRVTDARGLQSTNTASLSIRVTPGAPVITLPAAGVTLNTPTVTISGTTDPNLTVDAFDDGIPITTTVADATGAFSFARSYLEGTHAITVTATDALGDTGPASAARTFTIDTIAPAAPAIDVPAISSTVSDSYVAFSGTSEPFATVRIRSGGLMRATVRADGSGIWIIRAGFVNGAHTIEADATDAAGNTGTATARSFTVADTTAPAAPAILAPAQSATLTVSPVMLNGTAEPGTRVALHDGADALGEAAVNDAGAWFHLLSSISPGAHSITAIATDTAGNVGAQSSVRTFTFNVTAAPQLTVSSPTPHSLQPGDVVATGEAPAGAVVSVFEGSTRLGTVTANSAGSWTAHLRLPSGLHRIVATSSSATTSSMIEFTVDAELPEISVTTPARSVMLPDTPVTIEGRASDNRSVIGVTVTYFDALKNEIASEAATCACAPGATSVSWIAEPSLPSGYYTVVARSIDQVGNISLTGSTSFIKI